MIIKATPFNTLMQQAFYTKNIEILDISIYDIKKALAQKSITDSAKKPLTKYHNFLNVFSQVNSDILSPYYLHNYKIPLIEDKIPPWGSLYSMS